MQLYEAAGGERDVQRLRAVGQVSNIQRQPGAVSAGKKTRRVQLGDQRRGDHHFAFSAAKLILAPGLGHHPQLAVEITDWQRHRAFAVLIQRHRLRLLGDDIDVVNRRLPAPVQLVAVAAKAQGRRPALAFNHLAVDIIDVGPVAFLTKEGFPRIRRDVVGNIEHAAVYRREQHVHLFRHFACANAGLDLNGQRLVRAHLLRTVEAYRQTAALIAKRQMQQTDRALRRRGARLIAGTHHQRAKVEIVTLPGFIHRDSQIQPLCRNVDLLPPQRTIAGLHHRIALTGSGGSNMQLDGIAGLIGGLIELQGDAVRTRRIRPVVIILPAVTCPEAHAADCLIRRFDLKAVGTPLYGEADFTGLIRRQVERLLALHQILLIELGLPAVALGPVPVVVATLADQPHLQIVYRFFHAVGINVDNVKTGLTVLINRRPVNGGIGAVVIDGFSRKLRTNTRQRGGGPDGLLGATGHWTTAGLQQACLKDQLQRRMGLLPLAISCHFAAAFLVQRYLYLIKATREILLGNVTELEAWQRRDSLPQRAQEQLSL